MSELREDSQPTRKTGGQKRNAPQRPRRVPLHAQRDQIAVKNMSPNHQYRWVRDKEGGSRLLQFETAGYEYAKSDDHLVGDALIYNSSKHGSIVRVPADPKSGMSDDYLYLMRIRKDWYEEDQAAKQGRVLTEEDARGRQMEEGQYGAKLEQEEARFLRKKAV